MTPLQYYQSRLETGDIIDNSEQRAVLSTFESIHSSLLKHDKPFSFLTRKKDVKGLYLWGSVGSGKTMLMDMFYYCLPIEMKRRMHFHQFMSYVHGKLQHYQGQRNPLKLVAKAIAKDTKVLCFDEFIVIDILDAMVFAGLLKELFEQDICIIATSNIQPDHLYEDGLQREQFLAAIDLIKKHMQVVQLSSHTDYRTKQHKRKRVYFSPLNDEAAINMERYFAELSGYEEGLTDPLWLFERPIKVIKRTDKVVWFDFAVICGVPRSQEDYLALSKVYNTVFISNIVKIKPSQHGLIRSFINLIDVLYNAEIKLVVSAQVLPEEIYEEGQMSREYKRTKSRLIEMTNPLIL